MKTRIVDPTENYSVRRELPSEVQRILDFDVDRWHLRNSKSCPHNKCEYYKEPKYNKEEHRDRANIEIKYKICTECSLVFITEPEPSDEELGLIDFLTLIETILF